MVRLGWGPGGTAAGYGCGAGIYRSAARMTPTATTNIPPNLIVSRCSRSRRPVVSSDLVRSHMDCRALPPDGVGLHAARAGAGLQHRAFRRLFPGAGGEPAARPGVAETHAMAALGERMQRLLREAA